MKQIRKLLAILLLGTMTLCVGCSEKKNTVDVSNEVATQTKSEEEIKGTDEKVAKVALSSEELLGNEFKIKAPEGWETSVESGAVKMNNGKDESIAAILVPNTDFKEIPIKEYVKEVKAGIEANDTIKMNIVNAETKELKAGDAAVFTIEMAFTKEYIDGWLKSGALTQERIDQVGGIDKFIETCKIIQIQTHILTDKGLMTISAQTINGVDAIKDFSSAVADSVEIQ